jgi:glycosyltransferase involved in cell wall biosynthesis
VEKGISVVIPVFNASATLAETLRSVASQSVVPSEIIIVDDGSIDGSAMIAAEVLMETGLNYSIIRKDKNEGLGSARNEGIRESSSEWVAFLDSDDIWEPDKVKSALSMISDMHNPPGVLYHSMRALNGG